MIYRLLEWSDFIVEGDECCSKERYGTKVESWFSVSTGERNPLFIYRRPIPEVKVEVSPNPQWISCKECLPNEAGLYHCLTYHEDANPPRYQHCLNDFIISGSRYTGWGTYQSATHWRENPDFPARPKDPDEEAFEKWLNGEDGSARSERASFEEVWSAACAYARGEKV